MNYNSINSISDVWFERFYACFEASFPLSERRPLASLKDKMEHDDRFRVEVVTEECESGDVLIGLLCWWRFNAFCYVEYLAVSESLRGRNIGSRIMTDLQQRVSLPIVLEVEPPEDDITRRRIAFYERLGFKLLPDDYMQPSYGDVPGLPLRLMVWPHLPMAWSVDAVARTLHREVYGVEKI